MQNGPGVSEEAKILDSVIYVCKLNIYIFCMQQISQIHLKKIHKFGELLELFVALVSVLGMDFLFPQIFGDTLIDFPNTVW